MSMHRILSVLIAMLACGVLAADGEPPELLSKRLQFRHGVTLEVSAAGPAGLRLDTVRFDMPATSGGGRLKRTAGLLTVRVAVSNTAEVPRRVGLAIALFDEENRLLGVASGGNKLTPVKPGRQKTFSLVFDDVNALAPQATAFHISLEAKP